MKKKNKATDLITENSLIKATVEEKLAKKPRASKKEKEAAAVIAEAKPKASRSKTSKILETVMLPETLKPVKASNILKAEKPKARKIRILKNLQKMHRLFKDVGYVLSVGDGIVGITGLRNVAYGEMVEILTINGPIVCLVLNIER